MIAASKLPATVQELSITAFRKLAEAEAAVHGTTPDKVHFHEVGAVDAIVDICGACLAFHLLNIDKVICAPIALGSGTVKCEHGIMPVPVPAVCKLLTDVPSYTGPVAKELTTPTGAAIIRAICDTFDESASGSLTITGYGAGTRDIPGHANVLQVSIYDGDAEATTDVVTVLTCNLDDATGEDAAALVDALLEAGALDAVLIPCTMKKGRPGIIVEALAPNKLADDLATLLLRHSSSFGLRRYQAQRTILNRFFTEVDTAFGRIRVKIGVFPGQNDPVQVAPEFADCHKAAKENDISTAAVRRAAVAAWHAQQPNSSTNNK